MISESGRGGASGEPWEEHSPDSFPPHGFDFPNPHQHVNNVQFLKNIFQKKWHKFLTEPITSYSPLPFSSVRIRLIFLNNRDGVSVMTTLVYVPLHARATWAGRGRGGDGGGKRDAGRGGVGRSPVVRAFM